MEGFLYDIYQMYEYEEWNTQRRQKQKGGQLWDAL